MTCFLTSSPCVLGDEALTNANGFADKIKSALVENCRCLFIARAAIELARAEHAADVLVFKARSERKGVDAVILDSVRRA